MKDDFEQIKFIRAVGLSIKKDGLGFIHDYGEEELTWSAITHTFAVILKKQKLPFPTLFLMKIKDSGTIYYIDEIAVSSKYFKIEREKKAQPEPAPQSRKSTDDLRHLLSEICSHFTTTYIDKPLIACLRGGQLFLPTFSSIRNVSDYCMRIVNSVQIREKGSVTFLQEDEELHRITAPTEERSEWSEGKVIEGQYTVQEIRRGGMGIVYISFDSRNVKFCAVKTFQERYLWDERVTKQFIKEAEIWIKLDRHPNIVQAERVKIIEGKPYIFLEYIQGTDLEKFMNRNSLTIKQAVEFAIQFCEGMHYAYEKLGLIHRDIKPSNCLITREGTLKITDFGLGKIFDKSPLEGELVAIPQKKRTGKTSTSSTTMVGTLPFMAPELFFNLRTAGIKTDIYSFGIVLYMMLTGINPFFSEDVSEVIAKHATLIPEDPRGYHPGLPASLSQLTLKCLAKEPENRYESFGSIKQELEEIYRTTTGISYRPHETRSLFIEEDWINKGLSLASINCHGEAIITFDQALLINPGSIKTLIYKGVSLMNFGKILEGISCFDRCIDIEPTNWQPWFFMGEAQWKLGNNEEALLCFDRAMELTEENAEILGRKGELLADAGKFNEALACFDTALARNPRSAEVWDEKGKLHITMKHFEAALDSLKMSLEINPKSKISWYHQGVALFNLGFLAEAINAQKKALSIDPEFASAWVCIGDSQRELGDKERALEAYRSALKIQPENLEAYFSSILLLKENNRWEDALELLDKALEIGPDNPGLLIERAEILLNLFHYDDSLSLCQLIQEMDPENEDARLLTNAIQKMKGEQERIMSMIPSSSPVTVKLNYRDLDGLLSIYCNIKDALSHLEDLNIESGQNCYLKASLYFIAGDLEKCFQNLSSALKDPEILSNALNLKKRADERYEEQKALSTKKKGLIKSLFKKEDTEEKTSEELLILGLEKVQEKSYLEGARLLQETLALDNSKHSARFFTGMAYALEGMMEKAQHNFEEFARNVPYSKGYWKEMLGLFYLSNPLEVEKIFYKWIERHPRDHYPWVSYLTYLSEKKYYKKAQILANVLLKKIDTRWDIKEKDTLLSNIKGTFQLILGRFREAQELYSMVLGQAPDNAMALMGMGMCFEARDQSRKARDFYTTLLTLDEQSGTGNYLLAGIYMREGDYESALTLIENALRKNPHSFNLMYRKGLILLDSKQHAEFFNYYSQIYSTDKQIIPIKALRALSLLEIQKTDDAIIELINILSIDQHNIVILKNLGFLHIQSQNYNKALTHFESIIELYPLDFEAYLGKGMASYLLKDFEKAHTCFSKACEISPTDPELWQFMGAVHYHLRNPLESGRCWDRAIHYRSRFTQAWTNKGIFLYHQGEYTQAQECVDRALRMDPENPTAWMCRAQCQWKLGNTEEAIGPVEKALSFSPQSIRGWMLRGSLAFHQKNYELSRQSYEKATQIENKTSEIWYNRALLALYMKNEPDVRKSLDQTLALSSEAKKSLDRALVLKPDFAEGLIARFVLDKLVDGNAQRHMFLARAQVIAPQVFNAWADEYQETGDLLSSLKPLELSEDPFDLPFTRSPSRIEPLEIMHYLGGDSH